jgi:uncharacterized phage protein gp47/JayE
MHNTTLGGVSLGLLPSLIVALALSQNVALAQTPMTNGATQTGVILVGGLDTWTFQATLNDSVTLRIGEVLGTGADPRFVPRIRLHGPDGASLGDTLFTAQPAAAELDLLRAPLSGTYTVLISNSTTIVQTGPATYELTLARTPGPYTISAGDEGGPLTNGATHPGVMAVGDLDTWTFQANLNDSITLRIGEVLTAGGDPLLTPRIRLRGPDGASLGDTLFTAHPAAAEIDVRAPLAGTYTVLISNSTSINQIAAANYFLTLAKTAGPYTISSGDQGGPLTNGATHAGVMPVGDLDTWSFDAALNDSITLRIGEVVAGADPLFIARIRLRGPDGVSLGDTLFTAHPAAAEIDVRAPLAGTYTVLISNSTSINQIATANYFLTLAKTAGPYTISSGDQGGLLTNGATHEGVMPVGDLDTWSFQAALNDSITVRMGEVAAAGSDPLFTPRIRLRGPDGASLGDTLFTAHPAAAEIDVRAPLAGTYTVLISNSTSINQIAIANYFVTLAKTAGPYTISSGDQGGALTNGATHEGVMPVGDLDTWTFQAALNDSITVRMGEVAAAGTDPLFTPRIRLRGPDGASLGDTLFTAHPAAAEIDVRAPLAGTYTVLISNSTSINQIAIANYFVTLAKTAGPYTISSGDQGGPLTIGATHPGVMPIGDLDTWTFQAAVNDTITLRASEVAGTGTDPLFTPRIRLRGPDGGAVADTLFTALSTAAVIDVKAPRAGLYTVMISNSTSINQIGTASYGLTLTQASTATMAVSRTSLRFGATTSGAAFVHRTLPQTVRLSQIGAATVGWTATPSQPWITVTPASGTGPATLTVGVAFTAGLPLSGTSSGSIVLAFTGATNTAGPIAVALRTIPNGTSTAPFGVIDTPTQGATGVTGSIAVTGWALDDLEVRQVRILRDPGDGAAPIFIGTAVLVEGARPDVAALNPTLPRNTLAGWGYLLLTNFLPNNGDGTFRLLAIADDADGHSTPLGTRTITCANVQATAPFGAIDTPAQGEVIGGTSYNNFGWVLARGPALAAPPNGTVAVVIDGVFGPAPVAWNSRPDLSALFPQVTYPGIGNALGVSTFNPSTLGNGVHTISWVVTADNGQAAGIGSRYFTVANSDVDAAGSLAGVAFEAPIAMTAMRTTTRPLGDEIDAAPLDRAGVRARRGFDAGAPFEAVRVAANGRAIIHGEELDRFEVQLGERAAHEYTGYSRNGNALAPLPIGSHLDAATGTFTWQPGVGFVHGYDLVFVRWANGRAAARHELRFLLKAKGSTRVGPQVVIDAPMADAAVAQPFVLGGWAVDLNDATATTGIETLHVWAYPLGGGAPIFAGVAAYGGRRPDVAALFGERFRGSGYGLSIDGLPPNTYDLAVFAWSTVENRFLPARVVRVTVR